MSLVINHYLFAPAEAGAFFIRPHLPKKAFHRRLCALRFLPDFVVGMPVAFAIFLFALEMPVARFQLKPGITLFFDMSVTSSHIVHEHHYRRPFSYMKLRGTIFFGIPATIKQVKCIVENLVLTFRIQIAEKAEERFLRLGK